MHCHQPHFAKNCFPTFLLAMLNFCIKQEKDTFIMKKVKDRAISTNVLTLRVSSDSPGSFCQKLFFCHFLVDILQFLACRLYSESSATFLP